METSMKQLGKKLQKGITELGLEISEDKQACLMAYLEQLIKWNKAYNLSGIKDPEKMVSIHLLDSLSILPLVKGNLILDVGTGAGLPGFVLAICCPEQNFLLLDSNGKKTRFMFQTATMLGLKNIKVLNCRIEDFKSEEQIDIVLSRAFSSLTQYITWIQHLLSKKTRIFAMKGTYPDSEIAELPANYSLLASHVLQVPEEDGERHLLEIGHNAEIAKKAQEKVKACS